MTEKDWNAGLRGANLKWQPYKMPKPTWDHDHCEFCWAKFMEPGSEDTLHEGYYCKSEDTWICSKCYEEKKAEYKWQVS